MSGVFGGVTCDFVKQAIPEPLYEYVQPYQTPGVDGVGYQFLGKRAETHPVTLIYFGTLSAVTSWISSIRSLHATSVSYSDDFQFSSSLVFVERVSRPRITVAYHAGGYRARLDVLVRPLV